MEYNEHKPGPACIYFDEQPINVEQKFSNQKSPVSCLGFYSSTVNNDAITRLQICSPRCLIYCAEPDLLTPHWN